VPSPFAWTPHPDAWLLVVVLGGGYLYALSAWGPSSAPGHAAGRAPATRRQKACFAAGVAALWIGADYPMHRLADEYLYSVHMLQHMLFQLVAPPLLLLGTPAWLLRRLLRPRWLQAVVRRTTRALPALIIVNIFVAASHTTTWVNATVENALLHFFAHVALVLVSLIMWWPVLSPLPELPHLSYPGRMAYLFAHSIVPTVPASFLTFAHTPLYRVYADAPRLIPWFDPVQDQQTAGLLMKIGGGLLLWGAIAVLFFRWHHEEESGGPDVLYWRDLELQLEPEPTRS
jgi:putative membrane protein